MISNKKRAEAFQLLREYKGGNPYILRIQKSVFVNGNADSFGDFQAEFVLMNSTVEPRPINKMVPIADWYGQKMQPEWNTEFVPKKVKIISYLGETSTTFVCYVQYRQSVPYTLCFLPKKAVLKNFLVEDYHNKVVDFERYDRLAESNRVKLDLAKYPHVLKEHQKEAVQFLLSRKKCILADDMGLGKTTSLSVAAIEGNFDSVLIICPASSKTDWKKELLFYANEKDISVVEGFGDKNKAELEEFLGYGIGKSGMKKEELLQEAKEGGKWRHNRFVIVNYDILGDFYEIPSGRSAAALDEALSHSPMLEYIKDRKSLIIIDEAHTLSKTSTNTYKIIKSLIKMGKPDSVFLSTGTPVTNSPSNFYAVLALIENDITGDWEYYMSRYCDATKFCHPKDKPKRDQLSREYIASRGKRNWYELEGYEKDALQKIIERNCRFVTSTGGSSNLDELQSRVAHIYLRRLKEEVLGTLPPKNVHELFVDLSMKQLMEYETLWDEYVAKQEQENPEGDANKALLEGGVYRRYLSNAMVPHTEALADSIIAEGKKVIIACCFDEELYTLKEYYGDRCVIFNGKMSLKQKDAAKDKFINDPNTMVFIGNIDSAGVGLTLVVANQLIFNDFDYVPGNNRQMEDRIYRIGQSQPVDIYYQIFKGTQYENMWNIVVRKEAIINQIIKQEGEKYGSKR